MTWYNFIDPPYKPYNKNKNYGIDLLPKIKKGKIIDIKNFHILKVRSKNFFNDEYLIAFKGLHFIKAAGAVVISESNKEDGYLWSEYNFTNYLQDNILGKEVVIENLSYNASGLLIADIYLGDICINKILKEMGFAISKRIKFSEET
jgi:hypothetical protein